MIEPNLLKYSESETNRPNHCQLSVEFTERDADFRIIALKSAALEFVTFGLARFYTTTRVRRFLWAHTRLCGDAIRYDGAAKQLLLLFCFVAATLIIAYLALERLTSWGYLDLLTVAPAAIFAFASWRTFSFVSWRFRANHTVWRGQNFFVDGSARDVFLNSLGWGALLCLTAGFASRFASTSFEQYRLQHTLHPFGELRFQPKDLYSKFEILTPFCFFLTLLLLLSLIGAPICYFVIEDAMSSFVDELDGSYADAAGRSLMGYSLFAIILFPVMPFLWSFMWTSKWKWRLNGVRFGSLEFKATRAKSLAITHFALALLSLAFCLAAFLLTRALVQLHVSSWLASAIGIDLGLTLLTLIWRILFLYEGWKRIVATIEIQTSEGDSFFRQ